MIRIGLCLTLVLAIVLPIERAAAKGDGGETTRFGTVDIGEEDGLSIVFQLNGKVTRPRIQGNSALRIQQSAISLGDTDYIILESSGGTGQYACPSSYAIVALSRDGIKPTKFFGNCSENIKTAVKDGKIIISLPKIRSAPKETYVYDHGTMTLNGKPFDASCRSNVCK